MMLPPTGRYPSERYPLVSARLRLRPATPGDRDELHEHWNRPAVRRYLWDDETVTHALVEAVIARSERDFEASGFGAWLLQADAEGRFVGYCGMRWVDDLGTPELLYSIEPERWRQGLATEAATAVLAHAFDVLGLGRVLGGVDAANHASRRVLVRLGARPAVGLPVQWQVTSYLELTPGRLAARPSRPSEPEDIASVPGAD